jgi:hypothetical protein
LLSSETKGKKDDWGVEVSEKLEGMGYASWVAGLWKLFKPEETWKALKTTTCPEGLTSGISIRSRKAPKALRAWRPWKHGGRRCIPEKPPLSGHLLSIPIALPGKPGIPLLIMRRDILFRHEDSVEGKNIKNCFHRKALLVCTSQKIGLSMVKSMVVKKTVEGHFPREAFRTL